MTAAAEGPRPIFERKRRREPQGARDRTPDQQRLAGEADGEQGVLIGRRLAGERALPLDGGLVVLSQERMCHHLVVCGATGAGKTETLMRLAWTVAKTSDAPVYYLDGKGDRTTAERFCGLMTDAGRETRVFPNQPFDGWRGETHEIQGRLMEIIDYAAEGPAAWYRDVARNVLRLVCDQGDGPPRSSVELLARMELSALNKAHSASSAVAALREEHVRQVRLRYEAFFGQSRGALDGEWCWGDTDAAYLLLDTLALREEAGGLARFLFEDFAHHFTSRKPREQFCLLIVDEFSGLAESSDMAARVEQARGFRAGLVLAPQVVEGMGEEAQTARILGSVETVICHRVNTPERIVALAGTRQRPEYSTHYAPGGSTGEGSARLQHSFKIDPNKVRELAPGAAYVISKGRAMKVRMLRAPELRRELPEVPTKPQSEGPKPPPEQPASGDPPAALPF